MNALAREIRAEIMERGPMPFAEFMRRALYHHEHGYYSRPGRSIGRRGDFFTSVSVGKFFGELLAFQFARWIENPPESKSGFQIVEAGAHDGQLARDILESLREREPALMATLEYWIVEPMAPRRASQQKTLAPFSNVRWFESLAELKQRVHGVIFANELLDAMPVHPFAWNAHSHRFEELGVGVLGHELTWTRLSEASTNAPCLPEALLDLLPSGYVFELCPAAGQWWHEAASALASGRLMTIDYGGVLEELLLPARTSGTLRAYSGHSISREVLENPGEQDITAHTNFSALIEAGQQADLETKIFTSQGQFLTTIARELWTRTGSWPQHQVRQFQTLTHPEHLGRPFRVLVQAR
jgi:SAM-dependent MidA family methyltransferase